MYQEHPLLEEMERIAEEHLEGRLKLGHEEEMVEIHFRDGLIEAVSSNLSEHRLGQHLLKRGSFNLSKLNRLIRKSRKREKALGETALRLRILDASELTRLLHRQAHVLLRRCLTNGLKIHSFETASVSFDFSVPLDPHSLILELARETSRDWMWGSDPLITLRKQKKVSFMPWSPQEIEVLSHLNGPQTMQGLLSGTGFEPSEVKKILGVLYDLGFVAISEEVSSEKTAGAKNGAFPLELLIPRIRNPLPDEKLEVLNNGSSFISDQFASLKVQIDGTETSRSTQVIGVSSPHMGDGKSLIASNLALSLSLDPGRKVILLDCDLRKPVLQRSFGISLGPGMTDYLTDKRLNPYSCIRRVRQLYLMTAGGIARNPVELLSNKRMHELIDYLKEEFDTILLDSPPLQPIADARAVFKLVDGYLMVIRRAKTPYRAVEQAFETLNRSKFLGVVFNDVKPQLFHTYYDYKYYSYGHNSYHYKDPQ